MKLIGDIIMKNDMLGGITVWQDRKRYFGMPISFTRYKIVVQEGVFAKLINQNGLLSTRIEDINLYRVDDLSVHQSLTNKLFGVGSITVFCRDASCEKIVLRNIKDPYRVYQLLIKMVAEDRKRVGVKHSELQY